MHAAYSGTAQLGHAYHRSGIHVLMYSMSHVQDLTRLRMYARQPTTSTTLIYM